MNDDTEEEDHKIKELHGDEQAKSKIARSSANEKFSS
jgi:hypothetical protein